MRKDLLSFLIACGVAIAVFAAFQAFNRSGDGAAHAAIDSSGDEVQNNQKYSRAGRKDMRRSISYNPDLLLNLTGQDIRAVLQEPSLIRREEPTVIWQFRSEACVLDLYFTTTHKDAADAKVVYYEVRGREQNGDEKTGNACMKDIVDEHNNPRMVDVSTFYKSP